jgi:hypothetical protein
MMLILSVAAVIKIYHFWCSERKETISVQIPKFHTDPSKLVSRLMKLTGAVWHMQFGNVAVNNTSMQFTFVATTAREWNLKVMSTFRDYKSDWREMSALVICSHVLIYIF